jgi:tetratricopeptide (TPR) repeat protein
LLSFVGDLRGERDKANSLAQISALIAQKDYPRARTLLDRAMRIYPGEASLHFYQAQLLFNQNQLEPALAELQTVINTSPNNLEYVSLRANILAASDKPEQALVDYTRLSKDPTWNKIPETLIGKAQVEMQLHRYDEANSDFGAAMKLPAASVAVDTSSSRPLLKETEDRLKKKIEADRAAGRNQDALNELNLLIRIFEDSNELRAERAVLAEELGEYGQAFSDYSDLIVKNPTRSDFYLKQAKVAGKEKHYDLANAEIEKAIALSPKAGEAFVLRGDLSAEQGLLREAMLDYQKALELKPGDQSIKAKLTNVHDKFSRMPVAKSLKEPVEWSVSPDLVKRDPLKAAYELIEHGKQADALPILTAIIKNSPNNVTARRYLAWCCSDLHMSRQACEQFKVLQSLDKLNPTDMAKFAPALEQAMPAAAPAMYQRAIAADPQNIEMRDGLCRVLCDLHHYAECIAAAQAAIRLTTDDEKRRSFSDMVDFCQTKLKAGNATASVSPSK